jgi:hypothetical protein
MGSSPIIPTIRPKDKENKMIWTVIYRDSCTHGLLTKVVYGPHGKSDTLSFLAEGFKGDVLAIIAGDQVVHFNDASKQQSYCKEA